MGIMDWGRTTGTTSPYFPQGSSGMDDRTGMSQWGMPAMSTGMGSMGSMPGGVVPPMVVPTIGIGAAGSTGSGIGSVSSILGRSSPKLGLNFDTANLALTGLNTVGNLWAAFQAQKLAKEQFKYTKNVTDTNLANQIQTYNTGLTDRANNRAIVEGRTPDQTKAYIDANSLKRYGS